MQPVELVIGLGNPGSRYAPTRHNAGIWWVDLLARDLSASLSPNKNLEGNTAQVDSPKCRLFVPSTYMNESGRAVSKIAKFYKISPEQILVAHDEIDLPPGEIKLKFGGGHGGHNGLRDIIKALGTNQFGRLRIGVGHPGSKDLVHQYVLNKPNSSEKQLIDDALISGLAIFPRTQAGEWEKAMTQLHTKEG